MVKKKRIFFETEEVVRKTRKGYIDLETDYFQFYSIAFYHLASLTNNCAKDFILWVMGQVDNENKFVYSKDMFRQFMQALERIQRPKSYNEMYMFAALKELTELQILTKLPGRGNYQVNPKLFWSDDTSKRISAIKIIESNSRVEPIKEIGYPIQLPQTTQDDNSENVAPTPVDIGTHDQGDVGLLQNGDS